MSPMRSEVKLPAHRAGLPGHTSGEQNVSKGSFVRIVPLSPAYPAIAGRGMFRLGSCQNFLVGIPEKNDRQRAKKGTT